MTPSPRRLLGRARRLVTPTGNLTEQSVAGGIWVGLTNVSDRLLQLLMVIVVARLIGPNEFGLMGIALLALAAFRTFSQLGLDRALVYNRDADVDRYLNTTLTLNVGRGVAIAGAAVLSAPLVAAGFDAPRAADVLRVLAVGPFLFGFRNPAVVYFQKDLDFHQEFAYKVSGALVQFVVALGYALAIPTVWALVFGSISKQVVQTLVSYRLHPYRPWPAFDLDHARELIGYGKWITGTSILGFLTKQGDDVVVGMLLTPASLGFYQLAYRLATAPNTEITHVVSRVVFPAYSKLQDDLVLFRTAFYRTLRVTLLVAVPAGVGIAAVAPTFVAAFLGPSWRPMVLTLQLLTVYGIGVAFGSMFGEVWQAIGRPDVTTKLSTAKVALMAVLIYPLTVRFGILGAAMTIVIASTLVIRPISVIVTAYLIDASAVRIVRELAYPLAAGLAMGAAVVAVRREVVLGSAIAEFVLLVAVGVVSYVGTVAVLETQLGWGLRAEFRTIRAELAGDDTPG